MFLCRRVRCASKWGGVRGPGSPTRMLPRCCWSPERSARTATSCSTTEAGTPLRRRAARGQAGRRRSGDRHTVRRPRARGGRDRDRGAGRLRGRRHLRTGARSVHPRARRGTGHGDRAFRQQGRDRRDRLRARRVLPAPGCLEVPRGRTGLQQRTGRAGEGLRNHGGRAAARDTAPAAPAPTAAAPIAPLPPAPAPPGPTPPLPCRPRPAHVWPVRRRSGRR